MLGSTTRKTTQSTKGCAIQSINNKSTLWLSKRTFQVIKNIKHTEVKNCKCHSVNVQHKK